MNISEGFRNSMFGIGRYPILTYKDTVMNDDYEDGFAGGIVAAVLVFAILVLISSLL
jgi:hypothetical protein